MLIVFLHCLSNISTVIYRYNFLQISDMFGRKKAHFFAILLVAVSGLISAFSTSWQMFASLRLVVGVSTEIIGHLQTNIWNPIR